ncbi:M48 family metallopeptidase [Limibacter armeniacum]|uniref:M48 family metallopeptidase n=1 Tax=Limibacter armeniacum TaxID=466084 RepID=UPI002FE6B086
MNDKPVKVRVHFKGIKPSAWEHPADRAALQALKKVPGLDIAIKALIGKTSEQSLRLLTLASAVRVNDKQFSKLNRIYQECCDILDFEERPELYVSQSPVLNAGAIGVEKPFITINSSMIDSLSEAELMAVLGHELGHIKSGHVLYKTLLFFIIRISVIAVNIPLSMMAIQGIIAALREWDRKSELSADRAGLLVVQDPEVSINLLMKLAGGNHLEEMNLGEFIKQAEEYENANSVSDSFHKIMNVVDKSHPFPVSRLNELLKWVQRGEYDSILRGYYTEDDEVAFSDHAKKAAEGYKDDFMHIAEPIIGQAKESASKAKDFLEDMFKGKKED